MEQITSGAGDCHPVSNPALLESMGKLWVIQMAQGIHILWVWVGGEPPALNTGIQPCLTEPGPAAPRPPPAAKNRNPRGTAKLEHVRKLKVACLSTEKAGGGLDPE